METLRISTVISSVNIGCVGLTHKLSMGLAGASCSPEITKKPEPPTQIISERPAKISVDPR